MKRVYHHYEKWEEKGMWQKASKGEEARLLKLVIDFIGNANLYGSFMMRVIEEWPYSCEHNLTDISMNRQAWIGQAAVYIALKCPEDITRLAWHYLTREQQDEANQKADDAIAKWERGYLLKIELSSSQLQLFRED